MPPGDTADYIALTAISEESCDIQSWLFSQHNRFPLLKLCDDCQSVALSAHINSLVYYVSGSTAISLFNYHEYQHSHFPITVDKQPDYLITSANGKYLYVPETTWEFTMHNLRGTDEVVYPLTLTAKPYGFSGNGDQVLLDVFGYKQRHTIVEPQKSSKYATTPVYYTIFSPYRFPKGLEATRIFRDSNGYYTFANIKRLFGATATTSYVFSDPNKTQWKLVYKKQFHDDDFPVGGTHKKEPTSKTEPVSKENRDIHSGYVTSLFNELKVLGYQNDRVLVSDLREFVIDNRCKARCLLVGEDDNRTPLPPVIGEYEISCPYRHFLNLKKIADLSRLGFIAGLILPIFEHFSKQSTDNPPKQP